ncbi:MAG: leucine--tRNA ligase [Thermoprotei archaeon]|nr:MAG: leucine--tRNA ligase [Thermoprotei archaeon]
MEAKPINDFAKFLNDLSEKWSRKWFEKRIFEADPDPRKPKFFITAAFPYPNSPMHIGHCRTYTITDIYARFKRMQGYNVLFPMGFHYTGTPILAMAEAVAKGDKELIDLFLNVYYIPKKDIETLKTPLGMAKYFHKDFKESMIKIGYSIDWRREFTSITPQFSQFIKWQFTKLREKGYLTQGTHPVGWCPVHQNPVGQHDTKGDVEPEIGEYTLILFEGPNGEKFPCATLRPETVFGVTNVWVNPEATYVYAEVDGSLWVLSEQAAYKLTFQNRRVKVLKKVKGAELIGLKVKNPATNTYVPILPGYFVDPNNASGVVMSVPAHAPYDYVALKELIENRKNILEKHGISIDKLKPISIISVPGYSEYPARDVVEKLKIRSQKDPKLEEATKEVYSIEYHKGVMKKNTGKYSGKPVKEAKDEVKKDLIAEGKADIMYEILNKPVYCRCGTEVVVKILENQWFIDYSREDWKELARKALRKMRIIPKEARKDFEYTIEWLKEKACARQRGLGTELPWSPGWIIESLSDSTIYMAFYTIAKHINKYGVRAEQLTNEVFDYIFLGLGNVKEISVKTKIPENILKEMREEFLYWYPVDSRHSAKELIPNHLTFYIFNHVAIFPEKHWPKQIVANGFVLYEGKKMSKSLRNIIPLRVASKVYGPDTVRLTLAVSAETPQDADFSAKLALSVLERLRRMYELARKVATLKEESLRESHIDRWFLSVIQNRITQVTDALEELRVREAATTVLYTMEQDLKWYLENVDKPSAKILKYFFDIWARLLSPFAPFIAEEIWNILGNKGFVSIASWPKVKSEYINRETELKEEYFRKLIADIKEILKVTKVKKPKKIVIYTAAAWKRKIGEIVAANMDGSDVEVFRKTIKQVMSMDEIKRYRKEVVDAVKNIIKIFREVPEQLREEIAKIDEYSVLEEFKKRIMKATNSSEVIIMKEEKATYDPLRKAKYALPLKPAIYIED